MFLKFKVIKREKRKKVFVVSTVPDTLELILLPILFFLKQEYDVYIVSSDRKRTRALADQEGVKSLCIPMKRKISPLYDCFSLVWAFLIFLWYRPVIVHSYTPKAGLVSMLASWAAFVPIRVHTFTGLVFSSCEGLKKMVLIFCDRLVCLFSTNVVPESLGVKRELLDHGFPERKMVMIGSGNVVGVDMDHYRPASSACLDGAEIIKSYSKKDRFLFCFVGRINKDKGIEELVTALSNMPSDVDLLLVGDVDDTNPPPSEIMEAIKRSPRIFPVGFKSDIRAYVLFSDVFVLPSYREGFPNVLLQAYSMGKPAIVSDVHGANEITLDRVNGWVVPVRDADALREAMMEARNIGKDRLKEMGGAARAIVLKRHERRSHMKKVMSFYNDLLRGHDLL